ncbi:MAG: hypothetical protein FWE50_00205 [Alphaproteobacteria bacterium]|nr:hypothetical protein [Alphaproteobacteria bacterium]
MKKLICSVLFAVTASAACASDGAWNYSSPDYQANRMNYVNYYTGNYAVRNEARYAAPARNCAQNCGAPVRVKTHTEIVDHYQVYQPVIVYQPAGTYSERRVVQADPCNH